jgi:DNA-binding MarR family transcriptional regulator
MADRHIAILDQLLALTVLLNADMDREFAGKGLTLARTHLLWLVHQHGPSTQRALAKALDVSPRNVTGLVDALVATGFVTREPHPTDRRAALVTLTRHGTAVARELEQGRGDLARHVLAGLPDHDLDALGRSLDHVLRRLTEETTR